MCVCVCDVCDVWRVCGCVVCVCCVCFVFVCVCVCVCIFMGMLFRSVQSYNKMRVIFQVPADIDVIMLVSLVCCLWCIFFYDGYGRVV